jgi:chromosome segregation ATPase
MIIQTPHHYKTEGAMAASRSSSLYPNAAAYGIDVTAEIDRFPELEVLLSVVRDQDGDVERARAKLVQEAATAERAAIRVRERVAMGLPPDSGFVTTENLRALDDQVTAARRTLEMTLTAYTGARKALLKLRAERDDAVRIATEVGVELKQTGRELERVNGRCGELQRENDQLEAVNHALREDLADARNAAENQRLRAEQLQQVADGVDSQFGALVEKLESAGMVGPRQLDDARDTIVEAVVARWQNIRP